MIRFLALSLIIFSSIVSAGDYYYVNRIDTYDPVTGLYYKAVLGKEERGFMSKGGADVANIAISNPTTGNTALLFKEPLHGTVTSVLFETGHKDGSIEFYGADRSYVQNNTGIPSRAPKNRLLVPVRDDAKKETTLFVSDKNGNNLKKLIVVPEKSDWHIDVRNSKLRVVHQTGNTIKIESVEW